MTTPMRETGTKVVATNRKARRSYDILDTIEAGLVLRGSEVKSIRDGKVQIGDAFARIDGSGEIWLHNLTIAVYAYSSEHSGHDEGPARARRGALLPVDLVGEGVEAHAMLP